MEDPHMGVLLLLPLGQNMPNRTIPTPPTLQLYLKQESIPMKPVPIGRGAGDLYIRYTHGMDGDELIQYYLVGLKYKVERIKGLDYESLPVNIIQSTYLKRVVAKLQHDLIVNNSQIWPWEVGVRFNDKEGWESTVIPKEDWMLLFTDLMDPDTVRITF